MRIVPALLFLILPGLAAAAPAPKLELKPCAAVIPGLPPDARCGTYEVWEDRAAKSGRKIPLRVVVLPARGPDRLPDPFVHFTGGPGSSSVMAGVIRIAKDLEGERDPATPPANAERAARTLKNHLHVVVPDGGHDFEGDRGHGLPLRPDRQVRGDGHGEGARHLVPGADATAGVRAEGRATACTLVEPGFPPYTLAREG